MGASLYSLYVPSGFGGRAKLDMNARHIFIQDVLAAITLVEGGARNGGARTRAGPSTLLSDHHCPIRGGVKSQGAGGEALRVGS